MCSKLFFSLFRSDEFEGLHLAISVTNQLKEKRYKRLLQSSFAAKFIKMN